MKPRPIPEVTIQWNETAEPSIIRRIRESEHIVVIGSGPSQALLSSKDLEGADLIVLANASTTRFDLTDSKSVTIRLVSRQLLAPKSERAKIKADLVSKSCEDLICHYVKKDFRAHRSSGEGPDAWVLADRLWRLLGLKTMLKLFWLERHDIVSIALKRVFMPQPNEVSKFWPPRSFRPSTGVAAVLMTLALVEKPRSVQVFGVNPGTVGYEPELGALLGAVPAASFFNHSIVDRSVKDKLGGVSYVNWQSS